jgi:pimeloyl-ACP methyl ester carboxylesterase
MPMTWRDRVLAVASHDAAGLLPAGVLALLAWVGLRWPGGTPGVMLAGLLGLAAGGLAVASLRHQWQLAQARRAYPPPGRRVDVGGYALHVWAEGEATGGRPPIVLFAGGHAGGVAVLHLHRALRTVTRSILIDRPGTGWSDVGPFPRTTAREAEEVVKALEAAGEHGPFVWAGHSFGGLLVANVARRRPDLVHTLVLLDPTPVETIAFGARLSALRGMRMDAWWGLFEQLVGRDRRVRMDAEARRNPAYAGVMEAVERELGPDAQAWRAVDRRAGAWATQASIFIELTPEGLASRAWDTVVYDRDLGDLPVWLVAPRDEASSEIASLPEAQAGQQAQMRRMLRFYAATRERYLATSTRSRRVLAPAGSGHNFVYEQAAFTVAVLRAAVEGHEPPAHG